MLKKKALDILSRIDCYDHIKDPSYLVIAMEERTRLIIQNKPSPMCVLLLDNKFKKPHSNLYYLQKNYLQFAKKTDTTQQIFCLEIVVPNLVPRLIIKNFEGGKKGVSLIFRILCCNQDQPGPISIRYRGEGRVCFLPPPPLLLDQICKIVRPIF